MTRIESDALAFPTRVLLGPNGNRERVPDWDRMAQERSLTMSIDEVVSTMREDYGVTVTVDASGRLLVTPP